MKDTKIVLKDKERPLWRTITDWTLMVILIGILIYSLYIKLTGTCPPCAPSWVGGYTP